MTDATTDPAPGRIGPEPSTHGSDPEPSDGGPPHISNATEISDAEDSRPIILVVDDAATSRTALVNDLARRYGNDYNILSAESGAEATEILRGLAETKAEVALVLADQWMPDTTGYALLCQVDDLHPRSKRALVIDQGDRRASSVILQGMTLGHIDHYITRPWEPREVRLYRSVGGFLAEWIQAHRPQFEWLRIVGPEWSPRCHELRDVLDRNGIPYRFHSTESERGSELLAEADLKGIDAPVVLFKDGRTLVNPDNAELAAALGVRTEPRRRRYDLAIVGAGPAGLAAAVYASSEGLRTIVIEREALGGQAASSSRIRNYLGFPRGISGAELASRAYEQAWLLGTEFIFAQSVTDIRADGPRRTLTLSRGTEIEATAVILATGVEYRRLGIEAIERFSGSGVFYGGSVAEAPALEGARAVIVGAGNSAGQAATHLSRFADEVVLVSRGRSLGATMSDYLIREIEARKNVIVRLGQEVVRADGARHLESVTICPFGDSDESRCETFDAKALFVMIGCEPHTEYLEGSICREERGYILTGHDLFREHPEQWPLERHPYLLETNVPGVFAVGDVRFRSMKRVASAVGDGAVAVALVHQYLEEIKGTGGN